MAIPSRKHPYAARRKGRDQKNAAPLNAGLTCYEVQRRCVSDLLKKGIDVRVLRHERDGGQIVKRPGKTTHIRNGTHDEFDSPEHKRTWRLPLGERSEFRKIRNDVLHFCRAKRNIWTGVATFGATCTVDKVGERCCRGLKDLRKFFADLERSPSNRIQHIFSVMESTVRTKGKLRKDRAGRLLYHVHVHFLVQADSGDDIRKFRWYRCFIKRFGKGSGLQRIKSKTRLVNYLLKPLERVALIDHGEFAAWYLQLKGARRMKDYGPLQACRKKRATMSRKVFNLPRGKLMVMKVPRPEKPKPRLGRIRGVGVVEPNTFLGKRRRKNRDGSFSHWHLWRNKQGSTEDLYAKTGVPEYEDLRIHPVPYSSQNTTPVSRKSKNRPKSAVIASPQSHGARKGIATGSPLSLPTRNPLSDSAPHAPEAKTDDTQAREPGVPFLPPKWGVCTPGASPECIKLRFIAGDAWRWLIAAFLVAVPSDCAAYVQARSIVGERDR